MNDLYLHIVDHRRASYYKGMLKGMIFVGGILVPLCYGLYAEKKSNQEKIEELEKKVEDLEQEKEVTLERIK